MVTYKSLCAFSLALLHDLYIMVLDGEMTRRFIICLAEQSSIS